MKVSMILGTVTATMAAAATASAAVMYVSSSRNVAALLQVPSASQSFPSAAIGLYSQSASVSGQDPFGGPEFSTAGASQVSDYLEDRITYRGSAGANDGISASSGSGAGSASFDLTVRFVVSSDTPYALSGPGVFPAGFSAFARERLVRVEGNVTVFDQSASSLGTGPLANLAGLLSAGTYDFTVELDAASRGISTSFSSVSIDRQLSLPAPGAAMLGVLALGGRRRRHG